jgi:hypothetical protein
MIELSNQIRRKESMNKVIIFIMMLILLIMVAGCAPGGVAQVNTPIPNSGSSTATPSGEINVPGFKMQINTPGGNPSANTADSSNHIAGVLLGLWHGVISPITLAVSFFNPAVQMYEVHNDGSQYNFGFLIGVAVIFLILGISAGSRRH